MWRVRQLGGLEQAHRAIDVGLAGVLLGAAGGVDDEVCAGDGVTEAFASQEVGGNPLAGDVAARLGAAGETDVVGRAGEARGELAAEDAGAAGDEDAWHQDSPAKAGMTSAEKRLRLSRWMRGNWAR